MNGTSQLEHGQPMELLAVGYIKTIFNTFMSKIELNQQSIKIDYKTTATKTCVAPTYWQLLHSNDTRTVLLLIKHLESGFFSLIISDKDHSEA